MRPQVIMANSGMTGKPMTQTDMPTKKFSPEGEIIQNGAVAELVDAMNKGEDILFVGPTGCGKTKIFTDTIIALTSQHPEWKAAVLQWRKNLAEQNSDRAISYGVPAEQTLVVMDGEIDANASQRKIIYALPQTLDGRTDEIGKRDLVVIDEAHHAGDQTGSQLNNVIADLERLNPDVRFIGATASPYPPEGQEFCPRLANARRITVTYQEAINASMITPIATEVRDYPLKDGNYAQEVIDQKIDDRRVTDTKAGLNSLVTKLRDENFPDMVALDVIRRGEQAIPTLLFSDTIADANRIDRALREKGIASGVIHSKMSDRDIKNTIKAYNDGTISHLGSVDMVGEGFDAPKTRRIVNLKMYMTRQEWIQTNGRAQRMSEAGGQPSYRDYGATTAIHGTMAEYVKAQHFIHRGGAYDAWTKINRDPLVKGICVGKNIYYAIAIVDNKGQQGFSVMRSFTDPRSETRRLEHVKALGTNSNLMSPRQFNAFTREEVKNNEASYVRLRSRRKNITLANGEVKNVAMRNVILSHLWKAQKDSAIMMCKGSPISDLRHAQINALKATSKSRADGHAPTPAHQAAPAARRSEPRSLER